MPAIDKIKAADNPIWTYHIRPLVLPEGVVRAFNIAVVVCRLSNHPCRINILMAEDSMDSELAFVRFCLSTPGHSVSSHHIKLFQTMGDRLAVCLLRAIYPRQNASGPEISWMLRALRYAFTPLVDNPSDRIPAVSLVFLETLAYSERPPEEREAIAATIDSVTSAAARIANGINER
jgi:hypothetical protein